MCFSINLNFHKIVDNKPIALIAKQSILVYKALIFDGNRYCTPFQHKAINFDKKYGMFFYETARFNIYGYSSHYDVLRGIYSFVNITATNIAKEYFRYLTFINSDLNISIHHAIIPKGSTFYIGSDNNIASIVSSNLTVFENETKYSNNKNYCGDEPIEILEYLNKFGIEVNSDKV